MPKPSSADAIYRVTYEPEAREQLNQLYDYIATEASPGIAKGFTDAIVERCERLARFPSRGTPRDDLRAGIRTIAFRRSVTIAYMMYPGRVSILGVFSRGRDYETLLKNDH